jgi:hypothetical protein
LSHPLESFGIQSVGVIVPNRWTNMFNFSFVPKLFLASFKNPKIAITFEVLDHFRVDALECKTAVMNFTSKVCHITDEVFPARVPVGVLINWIIFLLLPYLVEWAIATHGMYESPFVLEMFVL